MIKNKIKIGDITGHENEDHIIIAMNRTLSEPTPLAAPYVLKLKYGLNNPLELGSVLSFPFTGKRTLHMIVCHEIGFGGWKNADKYLRFGLDFLDHHKNQNDEFSIVEVGTGPIGTRDGADAAALKTAIATSFLPVTLFVKEKARSFAVAARIQPLNVVPYRIWNPNRGIQNQLNHEQIPVAA